MIQDLSVKIKVGEILVGSGCLFQPSSEYTYVLTAKHCLVERGGPNPSIDQIKILLDKDIDTENYLEVVDFFLYPNDDHDIALIRVNRINDLPNLVVLSASRKDNLLFYGYPDILNDNEEIDDGEFKAAQVQGVVVRVTDSKKFLLQSNDNLVTYTEGTYEITRGLSGAGVYQEYDDHAVLKGILIRLGSPSGAFSQFIAEDIVNFNTILENNGLDALIPHKLMNFDFYSMAFNRYGQIVRPSLNLFFKEGIIGISPKYILDNLKGNVFFPLERKEISTQNLIDEELWCGWSRLLTYTSLYFDIKLDHQLIKEYIYFGNAKNSEKNKHTIKFFYTNKFNNINDCVQHIYDDDELYALINSNDYIIINSKNRFGSKRVNNKQIKTVVKNIDEVRRLEIGINIDDPNIYKKMNIFHLDAFDAKFEEEDIEFCENSERNDRIKKSVNGVFSYVSEE